MKLKRGGTHIDRYTHAQMELNGLEYVYVNTLRKESMLKWVRGN
jgi:hypothetical protein